MWRQNGFTASLEDRCSVSHYMYNRGQVSGYNRCNKSTRHCVILLRSLLAYGFIRVRKILPSSSRRTKKMRGASWILCTRDWLLEETRAEQNRTHDDNDHYLPMLTMMMTVITTIIINTSCQYVVPVHTHTTVVLRVNCTLVHCYLGGGNQGELVFGTRMSDADAVACMRFARRRSSRPRRRGVCIDNNNIISAAAATDIILLCYRAYLRSVRV